MPAITLHVYKLYNIVLAIVIDNSTGGKKEEL